MRVCEISRQGEHLVLILMAGFILDKTIAVNSPKRLENAKIMIANTCKLGASHLSDPDAECMLSSYGYRQDQSVRCTLEG